MDLNTIWFVLIAVLLGGYCLLDGFDFGVGILHLFARGNHERRIHLNAIAPVWDGNEVWLLTGGGALFAAFPLVYATIFSGMYTALMLLLTALIFRAVSLEFRGKVEAKAWQTFWDWAFGIGSLLPALLLGVAFGNILRGVPINEKLEYAGTFLGLLNPFAIMTGALGIALFTMHGAAFLLMKTEDDLLQRIRKALLGTWVASLSIYLGVSFATYAQQPQLIEHAVKNPLLWAFLALIAIGMLSLPFVLGSSKKYLGFLATSLSIAGIFGSAAVSLFPRLVPSSLGAAYDLTIYNSCSTPRTLWTMFLIALIGMPIVIAYTIVMYRVFKGKVVIDKESY
jgi:cytochrome bd ubiquinol oxidase subunit II